MNLTYFGTALDCAGHYFWDVKFDKITRSPVYFKDLPFEPEALIDSWLPVGEAVFKRIEGYNILAFSGSCFDKRGGSKTVFFTKDEATLSEMLDYIKAAPILQKMFSQMPFKI